MRISYSKVDCFAQCPMKYKFRYIDEKEMIPDDSPSNAAYLGTAIHKGIETDADTAIAEYFDKFPVISDLHINEAIKLKHWIQKAKDILPKGKHEVMIAYKNYIGFIDLLVPVGNGMYDIYDFKHSNNLDYYLNESQQLEVYSYFAEKAGYIIRNLYYVFIPKVQPRQKKTENLWQYRQRLQSELDAQEINIVQVTPKEEHLKKWFSESETMISANEFPKQESSLCKWCDYKDLCEKGESYMELPKMQRREIGEVTKKKIWIYGAAFSGKTTMLDDAPNPLNLNTDGNIKFVTMPYMAIKDKVTKNGRLTERKYAWEVFKEVIEELEAGGNEFKTIIIDLLEDTREMCRIYMYDQLGIQHESDSGFGKGWDIIKTEYLGTIKRFFNLDYENLIVVSHEDISKDITKKNGQNITKIAPNIQEAIANKVAGMVDIVARVIVEDDGTRTLNFKSNEVVFGGGRLKGIKETRIPLDWEALMNVYDNATQEPKKVKKEEPKKKEEPEEEPEEVKEETPAEEKPAEEPKRRERRRRD